MITPDDIKIKVIKYWKSGNFLSDWCRGDASFPLNIPFGKKSGSVLSDNYSEISKGLELLIGSSKVKMGRGYSIDFRNINHHQLGKQRIPERIYIESEQDFFFLCKKEKEFILFKKNYYHTEKRLNRLLPYICEKPVNVLKYSRQWEKLISVCLFFLKHPKPSLYIRQIVIPDIDTKFIEAHKKIINELMIFLEPEYSDSNKGISQKAFEKRFGLLYDEPLIRFRILDDDLSLNRIADISIPVSDFASLSLSVEKIFITENKINGLSFPPVKRAMVIFGLGYGIQIINEIPWLKNKEIYYWGDIDTHGYSILSMVRQILPHCRSFLMDEETLVAHKEVWGKEPDTKRFPGDLHGLTVDESLLFENLKNDVYGKSIRLEQELVGYNYLKVVLKG